MPETVPPTIQAQKNLQATVERFPILLEVELDQGEAIRVTSHDQDVTHDGRVFVAYPIEVGIVQQDGRGTLPNLNVTAWGLADAVITLARTYRLKGRRAEIRFTTTADPDEVIGASLWTISTYRASPPNLTLVLAQHKATRVPFPPVVYDRTTCQYRKFGGALCGAPTNLTNLTGDPQFDPTICDRGKDSPNGCRKHGDNQVANGVPRLHPERFGAFEAIPKKRV